ncbi:dnaJ homolog subfamily C member 22 [Oncorhynchus nerka]|uniref:dnaJ homolog subfamily C member 22 n=1 Tax=Oncorhynchus nerka TaxID=8023 RepID=UPI0031B85BEB
MTKSVTVTYALWVMGGPLGLHHLYLGRDSHALLWMLTLGGFGVGWAREFFRIPAYVGEANRETVGGLRDSKRHPIARPPPVSVARFAGQISVGIYFGTVALIGLNSLSFFYLIVLPLCVGAGVHLVSSVGEQTTDLHKTLIACVITSPIFYGSTISPLPISIAASVTASQHRRFKTHPSSGSQQELGPRLYRLALVWLAFSAPLGYSIFHNTTATLYYLSDCVAALLDMFWFFPWLRSVVEYFLLLPYRILGAFTGWGPSEESWRKVLEILLTERSQREREALQMLSVNKEASMDEITHSYRELVKVWHPDHNPGSKMEEAQKMFIQIQEAYETLLRGQKPEHRNK